MEVEYKEGQQFCYDCGQEFVPEGEPAEDGTIVVTCPNPECNRGSWAKVVNA